jgi:hypothetical protein
MANPFSPIASADARQAAATAFAATGHVRLAPVLPGETADALHRWLHDEADFARVLNQGDKVWDLDAKARAALEPERQLALVDAVHAQAREGSSSCSIAAVSENPAERAARDTPVDRLISAFNTPPWLDLFRTLTGEPAIRLVDGQATRYLPGHFLTGHDDDVAGKNRWPPMCSTSPRAGAWNGAAC